ncbi:CueP family metal-binding protein [Paenibacillus sp. M1]|uniref:CueP family metal-binding protein n=1 Tax=Paenibacillus haidiansis TaxID=1574488 RepID=A0ABU7VPP9_9BACL
MKPKNMAIAFGAIAVVAVGTYFIAGGGEETKPQSENAQNIKQLVQDYSAGSVAAQSASITSEQLIVKDGNSKTLTYDLPQDEFFLSIAPYIENTHPCEIHSLTGCQGEMADKQFQLTVVDQEGNTVLDKSVQSQSNGFVDLWLPRNQTYEVTIEHDGKSAKSELSTFEGDNTCITTMQLG